MAEGTLWTRPSPSDGLGAVVFRGTVDKDGAGGGDAVNGLAVAGRDDGVTGRERYGIISRPVDKLVNPNLGVFGPVSEAVELLLVLCRRSDVLMKRFPKPCLSLPRPTPICPELAL